MDIQITIYDGIYVIEEGSEKGVKWVNSDRMFEPFKYSLDMDDNIIKDKYIINVVHKMLKAGLEVIFNEHSLELVET